MNISIIDPHVHLRGAEYLDRKYRELAIRDCRACGIKAMIEMPNPLPQLTTKDAIETRGADFIVKRGQSSFPLLGVHIGITNDIKQVKKAIAYAQDESSIVHGIKMFLTHSTGDMGILDHDYQRKVWKTLVQCGYNGTVLMHCEDEVEWHSPYYYSNPITHSLRQNPESEYVQVERQLANARDAKFRGTFYVCHVSNPATIRLLRDNSYYGFTRCSEVTWHHMLLNYEDYRIHGNRVKMNPPLRSPAMQELLLEEVLKDNVDIIGSDHAPHPVEAKDGTTPPSGIPALPFWPKGIQILHKLGVDVERLQRLCGDTAQDLFGYHSLDLGHVRLRCVIIHHFGTHMVGIHSVELIRKWVSSTDVTFHQV